MVRGCQGSRMSVRVSVRVSVRMSVRVSVRMVIANAMVDLRSVRMSASG